MNYIVLSAQEQHHKETAQTTFNEVENSSELKSKPEILVEYESL
ncbi:7287_t:CDS:2, partial [Racocetra persica]